jgi:hypothetical protein
MNPDRQQALEYLRAPAGGLWHWAENGGVLVWHDGTTIAFREEVSQILEWLAPNELPSFGAIVFLLAACRGKVPAVTDIVTESKAPLPTGMGKDAAILLTARQQLKVQLEAALAQLAGVSRLPAEQISGIKAKCVLAEAVFELAKVARYVEARGVLHGLREPMMDAELVDPERPGVTGSYIRQIHIVAEGLKLHTPESLALRLATGLDSLPKGTDADVPTAERARRLIEELSRDREHGAVGRAARELMAAVRLPRRLGEREQLAIGGVADITNRGPLDRLLLSELAHDDLTLSVRVALNEALYLRREPPMREPPGALALLLDSGLRLWGVPRVLAAAVALALVACDKQHREVFAWRARGKRLEPVDLLSRRGLAQHLAALEPAAHAGEALPAFAEAVPPGTQNQSVLITHPDALEDPELRRALADNPAAPGFIATVDREGRFMLHALPLARRPAVCEAELELASVFEEPTGIPPIKAEVNPDLPAILGLSPFPFLLPVAGKVECWTRADGFTYAALKDRRLARFQDRYHGGRVLASGLPAGCTTWMEGAEGVVYLIKTGSAERPARLVSFMLAESHLRVTDLSSGPPLLAAHRCGDVLLGIRHHDVRAYALSDGRLLNVAHNPHRWVHGRFFRGDTHFHFVVWDGERVKFEPVTMPKDCQFHKLVGIFDRDAEEGPWVVHSHGDVISTATGEKIPLAMPMGFPADTYALAVSKDGHRLHVAVPGAKWSALYDLKTKASTNNPQDWSVSSTLAPVPEMPFCNLYRIVESIARVPQGLAFCGRKNRWRKLGLNKEGKLQIGPIGPEEGSEPQSKSCFSTHAKPTGRGCSLQLAEWPCGSKAYLDSRGLLHLKSHDPALPEVSLVLADGEVAGWTSDGACCGPEFFFEGQHHSEPARVFQSLMRFLFAL